MADEASKIQDRQALLRFPATGYSEKSIKIRGYNTAGALYSNLPSNYPNSLVNNLGALFRTVGEEFERLHQSLSLIAEDKFYNGVRAEYLYQVLGSMLYLGNRSIGSTDADGVSVLSDSEYREFLLHVRDAYLGGSTKSNLEASLNSILGVPVTVKELFAEARKPNSAYGLKDAHKILCDIGMDGALPGNNVSKLVQDITFYTDLLRPAHTLMDTRLVWSDAMALAGGCNPPTFGSDANGNAVTFHYDSVADPHHTLVTLTKDLTASGGSWTSGTIQAIAVDHRSITLDSGAVLVVGAATTFYDRDTQGEYRIEITDLSVDDDIKYIGLLAPGQMHFLHTPAQAIADPLSVYDPTYLLLPAYQENASKYMDAQGRFELYAPGCTGAMMDRKVTDVLDPMYDDMRDDCNYPSAEPVFSQFTATAGQFEFTLAPLPVLGPTGTFAELSDLTVYVNGLEVPDAILSLNVLDGTVLLNNDLAASDVVRFSYWYSGRFPGIVTYAKDWGYVGAYEGTVDPVQVAAMNALIGPGDLVKHVNWPYPILDISAYGTNYDIQMDKFPILDAAGNLATASDVTVKVNGVVHPAGAASVLPLLGHVTLSFLPAAGDHVEVLYHYTDKSRNYAAQSDDPSYTFDAFYGNEFSYNLVPDQSHANDPLAPVAAYGSILEIGYRYRAYNLSNSAVLNSRDTLVLNMYGKPARKASVGPTEGLVGSADIMFSPEFLTDTERTVALGDKYLENGLDPVLKLHKGVPTFQQTFTDRGDFADDDQTAQEQSGLVEYAGVSDYRQNGHLFLYSDLRAVLNRSGTDVPLSSICDNRDIGLEFTMFEEYYPNREMRLNDYLDFVQRLDSTFIASGNLMAIQGSDIVKSLDRNWLQVPHGGTLHIGADTYTVVQVVNSDTLKLNPAFSGTSGLLAYSITLAEAPQVKVRLNEVTRRVLANFPETSPYSPAYTAGATGFTPWIIETAFKDPDSDPYPRNPHNPNYATPPAPLLTNDIHSDSGEVDLLLGSTAADKMIKFRNWDQDLIVAGMGIMVEEPITDMDDLGDAISVLYWDVANQVQRKMVYQGTVAMTSTYQGVVPAVSYPNGLLRLVDAYDASGLNDATYALWNTVVRQIRHDGLVDLTQVDEFVRL